MATTDDSDHGPALHAGDLEPGGSARPGSPGDPPAADDGSADAVAGVASADRESPGEGAGDGGVAPPGAPHELMRNLDAARLYRARGWIPLPVRGEHEASELADWQTKKRLAECPGITDDDLEHYRANAFRSNLKRPLVREWRGRRWIDAPPDDAQLCDWFEHHPDRGIFLLTGPGAGLCVVDIDTYKNGDVDPQPWIDRAAIVATTPRGGVQCYFAEDDVPSDSDWPMVGIDRRGAGGGVAAPAGLATPGRAFLKWGETLMPWPRAELDALAAAQPADSPSRRRKSAASSKTATPASTTAATSRPVAAPGDASRLRLSAAVLGATSAMSRALIGPCPDGTRTASAKEIVGMLCRAQPVPDDAAAAVLGLLEQRFADVPTPARSAMLAAWAAALASPLPRSEDLVVAVMTAWGELRCDPPWQPSAGPVSEVAASLWRTASANEAAKLAAAVLPPPPPAPPPTPDEPDPDDPTLAQWAPRESDRYTHAKYRARLLQGRLSFAKLPGWICRDSHDISHGLSIWGHGLGTWLDRAIGGLRPGKLIVLGARKAKGGKTAFIHQLVDGLAMLSVERLDLVGSSAPLLMVVWVTEMDLDELPERGLARYLGVSQGHFQGDDPAQSDVDLVDAYFGNQADKYRRARKFVRLVEVGELLQHVADGPALLNYVEELVNGAAARLAEETGREVWPVVVVDPYQRRTENSDDTTGAETTIAKTLDALTDKNGWITLLTSDTTKASATDSIDPATPPDIAVATVMRGSYAATHVADVTMALDVLVSSEQQDERRALVYVGVTRGAPGSDKPIPFRYWRSFGRFVAIDPSPPDATATLPPLAPSPPPDSDNEPRPPVKHKLKIDGDGKAPRRRKKTSKRGAHLRKKAEAT